MNFRYSREWIARISIDTIGISDEYKILCLKALCNEKSVLIIIPTTTESINLFNRERIIFIHNRKNTLIKTCPNRFLDHSSSLALVGNISMRYKKTSNMYLMLREFLSI